MWVKESITPGELDALRIAAEKAWSEDTRFPLAPSDRSDRGQCYVTSRWLVDRLGGKIARSEGHYAWMSPDRKWIIDLTRGHGRKPKTIYCPAVGMAHWWESTAVDNERTRRFIKRANRIFDNLDQIVKLGEQIGDAYPAEEPERSTQLNQDTGPYWHDEPALEPETRTYKFVYGNGQLEISPFHEHPELAQHAGLDPSHTGPMAVGFASVAQGRATWEVQTNVNVKALERIFKDYGKQVGWRWGGITNVEGEPISDEFAPKKTKTLHFLYDGTDDHLWIGSPPVGELATRLADASTRGEGDLFIAGDLRVSGGRAYVHGGRAIGSQAAVHSLYDFCIDEGLTLYAGNDNRMHTVPDLELENLYDPNPDKPEDSQFFNESEDDERNPAGLFACPVCGQLCPNWGEYQEHRRIVHGGDQGEAVEDGKFPEVEESPIQDSHFTPQQPEILPMARVHAARVDGFRGGADDDDYFVAFRYGSPVGYARMRDERLLDLHVVDEAARLPILGKIRRYTEKEPKDLLDAPLPFVFDIDQDKITVGQPGTRTSDIPGKFTPGGIVEGTYEPGGKVVIRTMTNTPYTVRHMVALWYYEHPELTVKSVHLQDDTGGNTKLAQQSVGGYVASLAAADPTVSLVSKALQEMGGRTFVVGGAVRDAVLGKQPKDIDLMVTGLDSDKVRDTLNQLPGQVKLTGKDFGTYRYKDGDGEVEIALPRRERSTGPGHQDFDVQADPHMTPQEDFYRRDFTANAMGVDLKTGKLLDPYKGAKDIEDGRLRMVNPNAFADDPLRVVRALGAYSRHGLFPDKQTQEQMQNHSASLQALPQERIQAELDKLFEGEDPARAIKLAHSTGVLPYIFPEVSNAFGYNQNNPHHELELGDHLTQVLDRASKLTTDPDLRLAALLHDIGKPESAWVDPLTGSNHYYESHQDDGAILGKDHEDVGAEMARTAMNRLRYPADRTQRVSELVQHHMFPAFTSPRGARRFLNRVGDHADDLLTLREADQGGKGYPTIGNAPQPPGVDQQRQLLDQVRAQGEPTNRSQLAINGRDLIDAGIPPGPQMGQILERLTQDVIDDPRVNNPQMLLTRARQYVNL